MSAVYPTAKKAWFDGDVDLLVADVRCRLYEGAIVYDAAHDFVSDLAGAPTGAAVSLTGKATTAGKFTATVPALTPTLGDTVVAMVFYVEAGTDATRRLLCFIDRKGDGAPLSIAANGGPITFTWTGPIFSIGGA